MRGTRGRAAWGAGWGTGWGAALLCVVLAASACQKQRPEPTPRPSGGSAGTQTTFLARGTCSTSGRTVFHQVPCGSERAMARVLARHQGRAEDGPPCPDRTDFVLHISAQRPDADEDGDGAVPQGYACMRNLEPPHPGDPGGGGGPRTLAGDCVYTSRRGQVRETACDGSGQRAPEFKVTVTVRSRSDCPSTTALYVQLGGGTPVGCARRL
ncbi:hypothetical protein [Streptomyces sp. NPDC003077]|uniref:hypothetical protein n=1 Tax=Streptomyces sp. NPDC003077 TaxID=3154443 RepID=UPI0033BA04DC